MITEHTGIVKMITPKAGGQAGTYWLITWSDDKKDNVFNADWMPILEKSRDENRLVNFTKEQKQGSKYFNITSLALATLPAKQPIAPQSPQGGQVTALPVHAGTGKPVEMTKNEWAEKDKINRISIQRQTALKASVELAGYLVTLKPEKVTSGNIVLTAKFFEEYLEGKEVQTTESKLVDEAKKLGAKEIKKEGGKAT